MVRRITVIAVLAVGAAAVAASVGSAGGPSASTVTVVAGAHLPAGVVPIRPADVNPTSELVENGDFEAGPSGGVNSVVNIPGWLRTQAKCVISSAPGTKATVIKYGAPGQPGPGSPGPADRGQQLFYGGHVKADQVICQYIDLTPHAAAIDAGHAEFVLSGWFGGKGSSADTAGGAVCFWDGSGSLITCTNDIGHPTHGDRGNTTGLLSDSFTDWVPHAARTAEVFAGAFWFAGPHNDGTVDDISLKLLIHT